MSEELKRKLQEARAKIGMTQKQFANALEVPLPTLIKWENDQRTPGFLARIALNAKLNELLKSN